MSFLAEDFGRKPILGPWTEIDPTGNQKATISGNKTVLPEAEDLGTRVNNYNLSQLDKIYGLASDTLKQIGANIGTQTRGEIPKDVQDMLQTNAATRSLTGGFGGTGMARNLTARDFGLTSLGIRQQGLDSATKWMAATKANSFDITSMFLSSKDRYDQASNERDLKWQYEYLKAQIEAMPDPAIRGLMDTLRQTGIAYLGGTYQQGVDYTDSGGEAPRSNRSSGGGRGGYRESEDGWNGDFNSNRSNDNWNSNPSPEADSQDWSNASSSYWKAGASFGAGGMAW